MNLINTLRTHPNTPYALTVFAITNKSQLCVNGDISQLSSLNDYATMSLNNDIEAIMFIRNPADLGAAIKERRKTLGLSQSALAQRAGVGRQWLVAVERGKPGAELALIFRVLNAIDMPLMITAPKANTKPTVTIDLDAIIAASAKDFP